MRLRAVPILLACSALLSLGAPEGLSAQGRPHNGAFGGFAHGRGGGGYGGRGFEGRGDYGRGDGPRGFGEPGVPPGAQPMRRGPMGGPGFPGPQGPPGYGPPGYGGPAWFGGSWRQEQNEVRQAVREGRHIPLGRAIEAVRRRMPGRELDADIVPGPNGRAAYRLRWAASDGRRMDFMVDAASGAILGVEGGP